MLNNHIDVSVVVVTYQSAHFIERCLDPLSTIPGIEVLVVDNASSDGVAGLVTSKYPWARYIQLDQNVGFAAANNVGFAHCRGEYVLLLNPDAFVDSWHQIVTLVGYLERHTEVAAVGPQLKNQDGTHQTGDAGWRTSLQSALGYATLAQRWWAGSRSFYVTNSKLLKQHSVEVDWVCGACMLVRKKVLDEIGGLDERIFMYGEDVEWGERAIDAGWKIRYIPTVEVTHLQGATQRSLGKPFYSTKWLESRMERFARGRSRFATLAFKIILVAGLALRAGLGYLASARNPRHRVSAETMWRYTKHVVRL